LHACAQHCLLSRTDAVARSTIPGTHDVVEPVEGRPGSLGYVEDGGCQYLGSYLTAIRADGVAKHADTKQKLDRLAENNAAILTLIEIYGPNGKTPAFKAEADKFQRYAIARRDRWNSVMELFMGGGNNAVAEVPFPKEFIGAVNEEAATIGRSL
jgi:hypothetical protein